METTTLIAGAAQYFGASPETAQEIGGWGTFALQVGLAFGTGYARRIAQTEAAAAAGSLLASSGGGATYSPRKS